MLKIISNVSFSEAPTETDELGDILYVSSTLALVLFSFTFDIKKLSEKN